MQEELLVGRDTTMDITKSNLNAQDLLREAKDFILYALDTPYQESDARQHRLELPGGRDNLWDRLSPSWKQDRDIAAVGFRNGVPFQDLPASLQNDRSFLLQGVAQNSKVWYSLPGHLQEDPCFPRSFKDFCDAPLVFAVLRRLPFLRHERPIWRTIINSMIPSLGQLASSLAPNSILSDRKLMIEACTYDHSFFHHVHESLRTDREFIEVLLLEQPMVLYSLPEEAQRQFPDLVAATIPVLFRTFGADSQRALSLADDVMATPSVMEAWFTSGGPFLPDKFPQSWREDKQIFLWIAEHRSCAIDANDSFEHASDRLKDDKLFMLQAVEISLAVFVHASFRLRSDFDLILVAFAGSRDFFDDYMGQAIRSNPTLAQAYLVHFAAIVHEKLAAHEAFFHSVLCGTSALVGPDCTLKQLDQGPETVQRYKELIAEYLGVPKGEELRRLRIAADTFAGWL